MRLYCTVSPGNVIELSNGFVAEELQVWLGVAH